MSTNEQKRKSISPTLDRFVADMQRAARHAEEVMRDALEPLINMRPPKGPGPLYVRRDAKGDDGEDGGAS